MNSIKQLQNMINSSSKIVFFGGAGVSTESGIPDFRSAEGLYSEKRDFKIPPETILSHHFFKSHTKEFYDFYIENLCFPDAQPNAAHKVLAELEKTGKLSAVITQNVDGLHQLAGSKNVIEIHGSAQRNHCKKCRKQYNFNAMHQLLKNNPEGIPRCECGGIIRPDIVLYNEPLDLTTTFKAKTEIANADMLIVAGTSLSVYPAANMIHCFNGKNLVLINKDICENESTEKLRKKKNFLFIQGKVGEVLSQITTDTK